MTTSASSTRDGHADDARHVEQEVDIPGDPVDAARRELARQKAGALGLAGGQPQSGANGCHRWDALGRAERFVGGRLAPEYDQIADEQGVHRTQLVEHGVHVGFGNLDADLLGARDQLVGGAGVTGGQRVHRAA